MFHWFMRSYGEMLGVVQNQMNTVKDCPKVELYKMFGTVRNEAYPPDITPVIPVTGSSVGFV